ncbi:conjugative transfer signal peptidase TraF (plasmid) [Rhizobium leguminosarum]|uniref:conjugative transfer signal peptidase TraF n=1 Tax=Rhizobium leguminosarum TaxID=384 RepID=UPI00103183F3|nr:conjugative transfer signal peptidase TraF [Rhizobium leguminosarum]TAU79664.1 conjugative transfer signal peptidase TraF [Rhizobium leguminosarum]
MIPTITRQRPTQKKIRPAAALLLATALLALGLFVAAAVGGFRINLTPSEPLGLWRVAGLDRPPAVGDVVFICPPENDRMREARQRGYLRSGSCPGDFAPLIKTVIATEGQRVEITSAMFVDGITVTNSAVAKADGKGRPLSAFASGAVPAGHVFLHSGFAGSYDSRYFGPLPVSGILGLAQKVLTCAP